MVSRFIGTQGIPFEMLNREEWPKTTLKRGSNSWDLGSQSFKGKVGIDCRLKAHERRFGVEPPIFVSIFPRFDSGTFLDYNSCKSPSERNYFSRIIPVVGTRIWRITFITPFLLLQGCISVAPNIIALPRVTDPAEMQPLNGFFMSPPTDPGWAYELRRPDKVAMGKRTGKDHTLVALALPYKIPKDAEDPKTLLTNLVDLRMKRDQPKRSKVLVYETLDSDHVWSKYSNTFFYRVF